MSTAATVVVLAKQPRPGRVKTRLQAAFTPAEAADLAGAALRDTTAAVRGSRARRRVLAFDGDPTGWSHGFEVVQQPTGGLGDRLAAAFAATLDETGSPVLLVGMDTPQVTPALLDLDWSGTDAALGLSEDGGYWAIGLRGGPGAGGGSGSGGSGWSGSGSGGGGLGGAGLAAVFAGVPMSTDRTGAAQFARLLDLGLTVTLLPPLRDVDLPADAAAVAERHPDLIFSRRHRALLAGRARQPTDRLFDRAYAGMPTGLAGRTDAFDLDLGRWAAPADAVDRMVVARCEPPVIDLGCGPGRMLRALNESGRASLGVDTSAVAVALSGSRGGLAMRRELFGPLPGEGRWGTALLLDGNVGIGGDVPSLLQRCRTLVAAGGLLVCEVDPVPDRHEVGQVVLAGGGVHSDPLPWARIGVTALAGAAAHLDLQVDEEWTAGGRAFLTLRRR